MEGHPVSRILVSIAGGLLIVVVLTDVFLTVLYARIGTGLISNHMAEGMWRLFRAVSAPFPRWRGKILAACGPAIVVALVGCWMIMLVLGSALIYWPHLGTGIQANTGATPRGFVTAMYMAAGALTTSGVSDLAPRTGFFRFLYSCDALLGISLLTLTLSFIVQIYNALHGRNALALKVHLATAETGDAAEMIAGLGPEGRFESGYPQIAEIAAELTSIKEAHHFHSVLLYFRFSDPYYAVSRFALVTLDAVTLIKSALDDQRYAWLKESAGVAQLWRASMRMLTMLAVAFLPGGIPQTSDQPDEQTIQRWRRRYFAALRRLRQAGIQTVTDEERGLETYLSLRARWDRYIYSFARYMAHEPDQIDPACANPEDSDERQEFRIRLRSAG